VAGAIGLQRHLMQIQVVGPVGGEEGSAAGGRTIASDPRAGRDMGWAGLGGKGVVFPDDDGGEGSKGLQPRGGGNRPRPQLFIFAISHNKERKKGKER